MTKEGDKAQAAALSKREKALAEALRKNLRRRKGVKAGTGSKAAEPKD